MQHVAQSSLESLGVRRHFMTAAVGITRPQGLNRAKGMCAM